MRLTIKRLVKEYSDYYLKPDPNQRFGQLIYNKYYFHGEPWPELFYEEDVDRAFAIVANRLVEGTDVKVINYTDDEIPGTIKGELKKCND